MEAGSLALRPGEPQPPPGQRGLDQIEAMPTRDLPCPVCSFVVSAPEVDKLLRPAPGAGGTTARWRMHAAARDADLCPHPGPGKVAYQADLVVCPSCGFTEHVDRFANAVPEETRTWVLENLRPNLRELQRTLLGRSAGELDEAQTAEFFNRQDEIPDLLRHEHYRVYALAKPRLPKLAKAEATWLAAFAARRQLCAAPDGEFLARRRRAVDEALAKVKRQSPGLAGEITAVTHLLGKNRSGKDRLEFADRLAARLLLAGLKLRHGEGGAAERDLAALADLCRERFARSEQDPLWPAVAPKAKHSYRQNELETIRRELEREIRGRLELLRSHQEHLRNAVQLLESAISEGECDGKPEEALFYAYLIGEFTRRGGDLPLAAEWFKIVGDLSPPDSPLRQASGLQLAVTREQAGDSVNLLAAVGRDSDLFVKLREIRNAKK